MMNFGIGGYGMMGGMGMSSGMGMMGGNVHQSFKAQYGCEDCFKKEPYWTEYPKPIMPVPNEVVNPGIVSRLKYLILGG